MRRLECARASVESVAVFWVGENTFPLALEFLGSIGRVRYIGLICCQYQNLYVQKRAVLRLKGSETE